MKRFITRLFAAAVIMSASLSASAQFPSVTLTDIDGNTVNTATLSNDGKPFVISFFATWCKPCLRELKAISELYPDWQDETGMKLIAVSIDESQNADKVKPLVAAEGWEYEVLLDPNSEFMRGMGAQMVPHLFIIDGDGNVAESHSGYTDGSEAGIIEKIRSLINDKK